MIVIRRMVDRRRAYTAIFLKGEPPKIFPTTDAEHARILQVYKQDRPHEGILNDFSEIDLPPAAVSTAPASVAPAPWPLAPAAKKSPEKKSSAALKIARPAFAPKRKSPSAPAPVAPLWLVPVPPNP